jgi:hypothetical protein
MDVKTITGWKNSDYHFTTVVPLRWILDNCVSGLVLEQTALDIANGMNVDEKLRSLALIRESMQRPFHHTIGGRVTETQKLKNAQGELKRYLIDKFADSPENTWGVLPNFVAVFESSLESTSIPTNIRGLTENLTEYDFSSAGRAALADGESRHLAIEEIRDDMGVDLLLKDKLLEKKVTVDVYHGVDPARLSAMFIDLNCEGRAVDNVTRANLDIRNEWVNCAKAVSKRAKVKLATQGRNITKGHLKDKEYLMITHADQMVRAVAKSPHFAVGQSSNDTKSWEGVDFKKLEEACAIWFKIIQSHFDVGPEIYSNKDYAIRSIPVRLALASLGKAWYSGTSNDKKKAKSILKDVNWKVGMHWDQIAGEVTYDKDNDRYQLAAAGGKQKVTAAVNALTNKDSPHYAAIRGVTAP